MVGRSRAKKLPLVSVIWKDMRSNASNDAANFRNKHIEQLCRVPTPCIDDHQFEQEELEMVGELSKVCSRVLKMPVCWRARPDIPWSVNSVASAGRKMDKSFCGRRLAPSVSYIHSTKITGSVAVWETLRNSADCDCFSLKTQSAFGGKSVHFPRSNLCSNQVDALEHWNLVLDICTHHHHSSAQRDPMRRIHSVSSIPKSA